MKKLFSNFFGSPLFVCFLTFLFFLPNILQGKIPMPADSLLGLYHPWRDVAFDNYNPGKFPVKNPLITDPVLQIYPWRNLVIKNFKEDNLPLWNPYSFSGQPLAANIQSVPFSLSNILFFTVPFNFAWSLQIILPPILASLFMFLFLKDLKLSAPASIFGAFVLPFTGFFIAWLTWGTIVTTVMWLPLILFLQNKLFKDKSFIYFLLLVLVYCATIFSGHIQSAFYILAASVLYLFYLLYQFKNLRAALFAILAAILGVIISAPQLLPSLEFIRLSARNVDQAYTPTRADWFLPPQNLIQLIAPDYFGNPTTYNYWGIWNWAEFVSFIGIIPLYFVLLAILTSFKKPIFFLILTFVSLLLALSNPISKIPYIANLPFISSFQPSRIVFLFVFSLSVLSAYGMNFFISQRREKKQFIPAVLILLTLFVLIIYTLIFQDFFPTVGNIDSSKVALRNLIFPILTSFVLLALVIIKFVKIGKSILIFIIFALTMFELFRFGYKFTPFSKLSWIFPQTQTTQFLSNQEKPFRIMTTDRRIFNGSSPSVYGIEAVHGYDPLYLEDYARLVTAWQSGSVEAAGSFNRIVTPQKYDSKIANLLNVKYVITFDDIGDDGFEKIFQEGETKIFINKNALPRAFFVKEVVKVVNDDDELAKLLDANFDLSKFAVSSDFAFVGADINGEVKFKDYNDQGIVIWANVDKDAPLFVSNIYYPGWHVYVDGQEKVIQKVNFMFQSVLVPQGQHEIEFKYKPKSFYNGLYLAGFGFGITIIISVFLWRKKYQ